MLKKGCGRKSVSNVWKYFSYDRASDKSRCLIDDMKDSSGNQKCDALLTGNNATNLKNHLKYKHESVYAELEKLECQSKDSRKATNHTGDLPKRQTQLMLQVSFKTIITT